MRNLRFLTGLGILVFLSFTLSAESPLLAFQRGKTLQQQSNYLSAVAEYRSALQQNPNYLEAWVGLSECFLAMQEYDQALEAVVEARRLGGRSVNVMNLHADVLLSLARTEEAGKVYSEVLLLEPNNTTALLGRAQIALAENQPDVALEEFQRALDRSSNNRTALLSLAIVADAQGLSDAADRYIQLALQHHNNHPAVHLIAARQAYQRGGVSQALYHTATAINLRKDYFDAILLQAQILMRQQRIAEAKASIEQLIRLQPDNPSVWYLNAVASDAAGDTDNALYDLERALRLNPGNEFVRATWETLLRKSTELDSAKRMEAASYHVNLANGYVSQNLRIRAGVHFRRALQLYPFSKEARLGYASMLEMEGYHARYLEELLVMQDLEMQDPGIEDAIEMYSNLLLDSVSSKWGIAQFEPARINPTVQIFVIGTFEGYPFAEDYLPDFFQDILGVHSGVDYVEAPMFAPDDSDAFALARESGSDYYLLIKPSVFPAGIQVSGELYASRTGTLLHTERVVREGAEALSRSLWALQKRIAGLFPLQAKVLARRFRTAVIDRGRMDGLEIGDEVPIYPARAGIIRSDGLGILFSESEQLGLFTVEALDDAVAEGVISGGGFFDRVSVGDIAVWQPEGYTDPPSALSEFSSLYRQIRAID
ncbi:MAG: hypothetical protein D6B26_00570 [Spirochaetaceae bacterium]|nr:MAG: hypothetical protein D6B26_00570 [Spirochaetaceae bacterium]